MPPSASLKRAREAPPHLSQPGPPGLESAPLFYVSGAATSSSAQSEPTIATSTFTELSTPHGFAVSNPPGSAAQLQGGYQGVVGFSHITDPALSYGSQPGYRAFTVSYSSGRGALPESRTVSIAATNSSTDTDHPGSLVQTPDAGMQYLDHQTHHPESQYHSHTHSPQPNSASSGNSEVTFTSRGKQLKADSGTTLYSISPLSHDHSLSLGSAQYSRYGGIGLSYGGGHGVVPSQHTHYQAAGSGVQPNHEAFSGPAFGTGPTLMPPRSGGGHSVRSISAVGEINSSKRYQPYPSFQISGSDGDGRTGGVGGGFSSSQVSIPSGHLNPSYLHIPIGQSNERSASMSTASVQATPEDGSPDLVDITSLPSFAFYAPVGEVMQGPFSAIEQSTLEPLVPHDHHVPSSGQSHYQLQRLHSAPPYLQRFHSFPNIGNPPPVPFHSASASVAASNSSLEMPTPARHLQSSTSLLDAEWEEIENEMLNPDAHGIESPGVDADSPPGREAGAYGGMLGHSGNFPIPSEDGGALVRESSYSQTAALSSSHPRIDRSVTMPQMMKLKPQVNTQPMSLSINTTNFNPSTAGYTPSSGPTPQYAFFQPQTTLPYMPYVPQCAAPPTFAPISTVAKQPPNFSRNPAFNKSYPIPVTPTSLANANYKGKSSTSIGAFLPTQTPSLSQLPSHAAPTHQAVTGSSMYNYPVPYSASSSNTTPALTPMTYSHWYPPPVSMRTQAQFGQVYPSNQQPMSTQSKALPHTPNAMSRQSSYGVTAVGLGIENVHFQDRSHAIVTEQEELAVKASPVGSGGDGSRGSGVIVAGKVEYTPKEGEEELDSPDMRWKAEAGSESGGEEAEDDGSDDEFVPPGARRVKRGKGKGAAKGKGRSSGKRVKGRRSKI